MAADKKSFIAYSDWIETFEELSDEEAGKLVKHLFRYVNDLNPEAPDRLTKMMFISIKRALKADLSKYESIKAKRVEAGRKGGKQTQANQANASFDKQTQANQAVSVNGSVSVSDSVNEISLKEKQEVPLFFQNQELKQWFEIWMNVCKEKGKPHGPSSIEALQMKLSRMPIEKAIAIVKQSASENWVTLQPLKHPIETEETQEESQAREIMETIKADNLRRTLYGPRSDEFEQQPNLKKIG